MSQRPDGSVETSLRLPYEGLSPGRYQVGLVLSDEGLLSSRWDMPGSSRWDMPGEPASRPIPGGPVLLTVTDG